MMTGINLGKYGISRVYASTATPVEMITHMDPGILFSPIARRNEMPADMEPITMFPPGSKELLSMTGFGGNKILEISKIVYAGWLVRYGGSIERLDPLHFSPGFLQIKRVVMRLGFETLFLTRKYITICIGQYLHSPT
jgi:hypothetical protein